MEQIFIDNQEPQIVISLKEYKELLVTKGKYESLKSINNINDKTNNDVLDRKKLIKFLNNQISNCIDFQLNNIKSDILKDYMTAGKTKLAYIYLLKQIERGEFNAD